MVVTLTLFFSTIQVDAATYYSRGNGVFTAAIWSTTRGGTAVTPSGTNHTYYIQTGHTVTLGANQTSVAVIVESGGTLTLNGNRTLTCPLTINSGGLMTLTTRRLTMAGSLTNNGTITGTSAYITNNTYAFINSGSVTLTTGRIIRTTGLLTNSGSITMGAGRFTATSGGFTNTATGTLTITGTATLTLGTGDFVNDNTSGSVNFGSSTVGLTGTTKSVGGFTTTGAVNPSNTSGTITITGDINGGAFTKSGAGTINMGAGFNHTFTGTFALGTSGSVNGGSSILNLTASTTFTGTGTVFSPGTSTVNFGGAAQTISATGTKSFYNLTYSNSGTKTNSSYNVSGVFSLLGTATASAAPTYTGAAYGLVYNTSNNRNAGAEWPATFSGSNGVSILSSTITVPAASSKTFSLNVPMTISSGATLTTGANAFSFGGDFINEGTWTPSTGDVTIALTKANQNIGALSTTGIVYLTKTASEATFTGNINAGGLTLNATGATLNLGLGRVHVITGDLAGTGGTLNGNTSTIRIGAAVPAAISFNPNTSTVDYNGSVAQTLPAVTYYNLQTSTANVKSLGGNTTVEGVFTNNAGATFSAGDAVMTLSGAGTPFVNNGTFNAGTSTISFTNAGSVNIPALNYFNLNGAGGPRVLSGSGVTGIANVFTPGLGAYTVTGSTVNFNGTLPQTIPTFTFHDVILTNAGEKNIDTPVSVKNITIETGPVLNLNSTGGGAINLYIW